MAQNSFTAFAKLYPAVARLSQNIFGDALEADHDMTLTASQRARNEALIEAALADARGKCCFCNDLIDTSVHGELSWHHHTQPKLGNISVWRRHRNTAAFEAELRKCAPSHRRCHDIHHLRLSAADEEDRCEEAAKSIQIEEQKASWP